MSEDATRLAAYLQDEKALCSIIFDLTEDSQGHSKQLCHVKSICESLPGLGKHAEHFRQTILHYDSAQQALDSAVAYACTQAGIAYTRDILNHTYRALTARSTLAPVYANL